MKVRLFDIIIFALALLILGFVIRASYFHKSGGTPLVSINANGDEYIYPLSENRTVSVDGVLGKSVIQIVDNSARFVSSPCDNHTCESSAPLVKSGDWSACLPNKIFMKIESDANTIDALTN